MSENGKEEDSWALAFVGPITAVGKLSDFEWEDEDGDGNVVTRYGKQLSPVFGLSVQAAQMNPQRPQDVSIVYQAFPILMLASLDRIDVTNATIKPLSELSAGDRSTVMRAVGRAEDAVMKLRAANAGVVLAGR